MGFSTDERLNALSQSTADLRAKATTTEQRLARLEDAVAAIGTVLFDKHGEPPWQTANPDLNQAASELAAAIAAIRSGRP